MGMSFYHFVCDNTLQMSANSAFWQFKTAYFGFLFDLNQKRTEI